MIHLSTDSPIIQLLIPLQEIERDKCSIMENAIEQAKQYASAGIEKATELGQQAIDLVKEQLSEVTNATTSTSTTTAKAPGLRRKESSGPLSPAEEKKLEDALANRPTPKELQEKNILKGTSAAPS